MKLKAASSSAPDSSPNLSQIILSISKLLPKSQLPTATGSWRCSNFFGPHSLAAEMIIKGLFRRYQRWNPVHPTLGAFWGMGLGIGCGVGWGPGFGPEVIGYVGAGCGAGFCVGITLAGIGIGLPANYVYTLPYNAFVAARTGALGIAESNSVRSMKNVAGDGWSNLRGTIPGLQQKGSQMLPGFGIRNPLENMLDISNVKNAIFSSSTPMMNELQRIRSHFFPPHKGSKE